MNAYELAKLYYPRLWNEKRLKALLDAGHITVNEYRDVLSNRKEG